MAARTAVRRALSASVAACVAVGPVACRPAPDGASPAARLRLHPCFLTSILEWARCGTFRVPEAREPLVLLHGGPGVGAAEQPRYATSVFAEARRTRDVLLVDQRGTGRSEALDCGLSDDGGRIQPYLDPIFPLGAVRRCAARLVRRADLSQYGTAAAADDLDELRAALGAARLDLFGVSYGTRAALVYLARYPSRVRRVVLQGVVAPDEPIPLAAARAGQRALDYLAADCAADAACRRDVPDPEGDVARVMARLRAAPAAVEMWNAHRLSTERVRLSARGLRRAALVDALRAGARPRDGAPRPRGGVRRLRAVRRRRARGEPHAAPAQRGDDAVRAPRGGRAPPRPRRHRARRGRHRAGPPGRARAAPRVRRGPLAARAIR